MSVAIEAYRDIVFGEYTVAAEGRNRTRQKIAITVPVNYKTREEATERRQLIKAGAHLLQLFNAIRWQP